MTTPPPTPTLDDPEQLSVAVELCRNGKIRRLRIRPPAISSLGTVIRNTPPIRARARLVEELAIGRDRSLQELAKGDGISRRYIRRLVGLAFLSPELVEPILQGRQPVELTATRLTELDLPLDWTEQHKLLGG